MGGGMAKTSLGMRALALALFCLPTAARGDPTWLVPSAWHLDAVGPVTMRLITQEDAGPRARPAEEIASLRVRDSGGDRDLTRTWRRAGGSEWTLPLRRTGTALVAVSTRSEVVDLDAARFADFLRERGFSAMANARRRAGTEGRPARMTIIHHAKALVRIGTGTGGAARAPVGHPLEIVPLTDPFAAPYAHGLVEFRFRVLANGRPLAGAGVHFIPLFGANQFGPIGRGPTDARGEARFAFFATGGLLLQVSHLAQAGGPGSSRYTLHVATFAVR